MLPLLTALSRLGSPTVGAGWCQSRSQARFGMGLCLGVLLWAMGVGSWATPARAQTASVYWQCVAPSSTNPQGGWCPASNLYPLPVGGGAQGSWLAFQAKIAVTNTAVQLASHALVNGLTCTTKQTNTATVEFGLSNVNTTVDGTGTGAAVPQGGGWSAAVSNSNLVYINGTANDVVFCWGN